MAEGLGLRLCFVAFLLAVGQADIPSDLKEDDPSDDSRTGDFNESDELRLEAGNASEEDGIAIHTGADAIKSDEDLKHHFDDLDMILKKQEDKGPLGPGPYPSWHNENPLRVNEAGSSHGFLDDPNQISGGPYLQNEFPKDPNNEDSMNYPLSPDDGKLSHFPSPQPRVIARLIPTEEQMAPYDIPGGKNAITCTLEGEIYSMWSPDLQCLMCVCLNGYGGLRTVCVSCSKCVAPDPWPPGPPEPPVTTEAPGPPGPPSPISCKPLPANTPFQSPMDPCKICVCTEVVDQFGRKDVQIRCQQNPQCVLPPYTTTQRIPISTEIPLPVCDKLPPDVPFPHPQDRCKICKCIVKQSPFGLPERYITCYANPECEPDHPSSTISPETETPTTISPEPDLQICDHYPINVVFYHPSDNCQLCKCTLETKIFFEKKKILSCYVRPDCIPTPPPTSTPSPWHPSTQTPRPTTQEPTPGPPPENAKCAPLPVGTPFQNPLNPCQICICTQRTDVFGKIDVQIECQENPQCIVPPDVTTIIPPIIVTPVPLPRCKLFPENILFPHPYDHCKVCKCSILTDTDGIPAEHINCYTRPECRPTPAPVTTPEPEPEPTPGYICEHRPIDVYFTDPTNQCKLCKCTLDIFQRKQVHCFVLPNCITTPLPPPPTTTVSPGPSPNNGTCAPLPSGRPFQNPLNPCQICICNQEIGPYGNSEVKIECQENPQCVMPPDVTTLPPDIPDMILPACDQFPENVPFPHPNDACKVCKCTVQRPPYGPLQPVISCSIKPECLSTPEPLEPTTQQPGPEPSSCVPLPTDSPFQNPLNSCQTCVCTVRPDLFGRHKVQIECHENSECVLPSDVTTIPPIIPYPIILPSCRHFPSNVFFPHPHDQCQVCKCTVKEGRYDALEHYINCSEIPECTPTIAPTTSRPEPTTPAPEPMPIDLCWQHPIDTIFVDPNNPCRMCECYNVNGGPSYPGAPDLKINCYIIPECRYKPVPTTTEMPQPEPSDICKHNSVNVPFPHPTDICRTCVCYWGPSPGVKPPELPGSSALSHMAPSMQYRCFLKPECYPPSPEPQTQTPIPETTPMPVEITSCKPLPTGVPFESPMNPCQICICSETTDAFGRPEVKIKCQDNPQCVLPDDVTTVPPTPNTPIPLPACDKYPTNVVFPHPQDACQECMCTLQMTSSGPKSHIGCKIKPECLPGPTTIAPVPVPEPSLCGQYPPDTMFTDPQDHCRICRCTFQQTPFSEPQWHIYCSLNPACSPTTPAPTTPAPWPPAPYDPLPGPSPHESCNPYKPNQPFQHPWDDCQVCICREAISFQRITIEVNCYSKPSCCVEPPFDVPGVPGSSFDPGSLHIEHKGSHGHGAYTNIIRPPVTIKEGKLIESEHENAIAPSSSNVIGPTGGNVINQSGGNFFRPVGEKWFGPPPNQSHYRPGGINWFGPPNGLIKPAGERWYGPTGGNVIGPTGGNVINSNSGNLFEPNSENWYGPSGGNLPGSTGGHNVISPHDLIGPENKYWYGPSGGNVPGSTGGHSVFTPHDLIGPENKHWYGPSGGNVIGPSGGNTIKTSHGLIGPQSLNWFGPPGGSVSGPSGPLIIKPPRGNWIQSTGGNMIDSTGNLFNGGNSIGPSLPEIRPSGNRMLKPFNGIYVNSVKTNNGSPIKPKDVHVNISPNIGFREAEGMVHPAHDTISLPGQHAMAKATVGAIADGHNPKAEASAAINYIGSTKMRTKSARPRDSDTEDYD